MTNNMALPSTLTLDPPGPLAGTLALGGLVAQLVIRRADGAPLSPEDQQQAAELVRASEQTEASDDDLAAAAAAYLASAG